MNEIEYILRILLKARDETAAAFRSAREQLRLFVNAADDGSKKLDKFNASMATMEKNMDGVTKKIREWRAVIQGLGDDNDDSAKSIARIGKETDTYIKTTQRAVASQKNLKQSSSELSKSLDEYGKKVKANNYDNEKAISGYKQLASQLDAVARKQNAGTDAWNRTIDRANRARKAIADIVKAQEEEARSAEDTARRKKAAYDDALADLRNTVAEEIKLERDKNKAIQAADRETLRERARVNTERARASAEQTRLEFENSQKQIEYIRLRSKAEEDSIRVQERISSTARRDRGSAGNITALRDLAKAYDFLGSHTAASSREAEHFRVRAEEVRRSVRSLNQDNNSTSSSFSSLAKSFLSGSNNIAGFDNKLRGLGLLLAAGFAQQLITVLGGLAGSFVALAGSAAEAGAAIGGIFVTGVMQAIPVIGLLGAAFAQVKGVIDAVKQAQLERQQASVQGQGADRRSADAADAVAGAQRRLQDAQEGLTKARAKARLDLEDLIATENEAKLAAIGAALSQAEAQRQLVQATARGDAAGIQRAQLGVLQAQADAEDKLRDKTRARKEAEKGRAGGVEGAEGVVQAKQQVADAQRGLEGAKRNAAEAAEGTQSAAQKLNFLLAQMTKGQRDLFHALEDLSKVYKETFGPITDIILNSFTRAAKRLTDIIQMPDLVSGARRLATEISAQLNRIFDSFTSDKAVAQFLRIAEQARQNLKPVTDIIINLGHSFANIGEAGGPAFTKLIGFVGDLADKFLKITENRKGLTEFFEDGEKHFEAWVNLGLSVIKLFIALTGAGGAESGLKSVEDATKAIDGLTKKIDDNREKVGKFFEDARKVTYEVVGVVVSLAEEMFGAFKPDRVENFAKLLKDVVIPALGDAIDFLGTITDKILEIADTPMGENAIKLGIALLIVSKIVGSVAGSFVGLAGKIFGAVEAAGKLLIFLTDAATLSEALAVIAWPVAIAVGIAILIAAVILLLDHLGLLDDAVDAITDAFDAFWKEVEPSLGKLADAFENLWDSLSKGQGAFALLRPILKIIIDLGGEILKVFGRTMGRQLSGIIDMISGVVNLVADLLSGRWGDAWDDAKDIVRGFIRATTAIFRALPELIWALLRRVVRRAASALSDLAESFGRWARRAVNNFMDFIKDLPGKIGGFGSTLIKALEKLGKDAAKAFVDPFKNIGQGLIDVITKIFRGDFRGAANDLGNAIVDLLNFLIPNKIGPIPLPDNPIHHLAGGGAIPGYGGGDRVRALLEAGEHVLTKEEVSAAGGHLAIFALRRALGGGGQGSGGRFQPGGAVAGAGSLTIGFHGGDLDNFQSQWRAFWNELVTAARRGANAIEDQFRDLRVNTSRNADLMYRRIRGSIADIQHSFDARGNRITSNWADTWDTLTQTAYDGLFYIAHETNRALHGLEEKTVNFGLSPPQKAEGHQRGGMIPGYGDGDRVPVLAEPGEGFINKRAVRALGGPAAIDAINKMIPRFQGGGMVPIPGQPGETIHPSILGDVMKLIRQYKLKIYDGFGGSPPHAAHSDHLWGGAIDAGPGPGGSWALVTKLANWAEPSQNNPRKPFRWVGYNGDPGHGEGNHLHLSWIKGAHLTGAFGDAFKEIARRLVTGPDGALKTIVQAGFDKTLKIANEYVKKAYNATFETGEPGAAAKIGDVSPGAGGIFRFFKSQGFTDEQAAGWIGNLTVESGLNPAIVQPNGEGHGLVQWGGGRFAALQQFAKSHGKPWQDLNTQLAFIMQELHGSESAAYQAIKGAKTVDEAVDAIGTAYERYGVRGERNAPAHAAFDKFAGKFAEGGIVPGPAGAPVPILAHAREWILNEGQVNRLAGMVGTSRDALRSMMGFYGGPGGAAGGTEATAIDPGQITFPTFKEIQRIGDSLLVRLVFGLRRIGKHIDDMTERSVRVTGAWAEAADQTFDRLDSTAARMRQVRDKTRGKAVAGFIAALDSLTREGGVLDGIRASIERTTTRAARSRLVASLTDPGRRGLIPITQTSAVARARAELTGVRAERPALLEEQEVLQRGVAETLAGLKQKGLDPTRRTQLRGQLNLFRQRLDDSEQRIADNTQAIFDAREAWVQAQLDAQNETVDKITTAYDRATKKADNSRRVADALGTYINNDAMIEGLAQQDRDRITNYAAQLQAQIAGFQSIGTPEALARADELADQIEDLQTQVVEMTAQSLQDAISRVGDRLQRNLGHLDRAGRMLDALGVLGLTGAAGQFGLSRAQIGQQRGDQLAGARAGYVAQQAAAAAQGNIKAMQDLTDTIEDLDVQIAENTKAIFDARVADVNTRHDYTQSILGLQSQIIDLDGTISGQIDQAAKLANLQEVGNDLAIKGQELAALLAETSPGTDAYQTLYKSILENTVAQKQNTIAVNEVTGATQGPQTFSTSAWQWFREAIFNGMGQVLPQYDTSLMGGINTGAMIVPGMTSNQTTGGDVNLTINEAGGPVDVQAVTSAITFMSKTAQ
jgi:chromosome segregation ATPase